jgi:hypothetical protein
MNRPYTAPGFGWILAIVGLLLDIVFVVLHQIGYVEGGLFALAFLAMLL